MRERFIKSKKIYQKKKDTTVFKYKSVKLQYMQLFVR